MKKLLLSLMLLTGFCFTPFHAVDAKVTSTINKNIYVGDGSTVAWGYTFPIINSTDIQIFLINTATGSQIQVTTNYSINTSTKIVTYPVTGTPIDSATQIVLLRVEVLDQQLALSNQGNIPAKSLETAYDKAVMISQQLQEQISRAFLAPLNSNFSGNQLTFPSPIAYGFIGWDPTASFLQNYVLQDLSTAGSPVFQGITIGSLGGVLKATSGAVTIALADVDYTTPTGTETLTNKTYDTAGTGNVFKINGKTITDATGNSGKVSQISGTLTSGHCVKADANGNLVDFGSACNSSGVSLTGAIIGTTNQIIASSNSNVIGSNVTLSLPQDIGTGSSPVFAGETIGSSSGIAKLSSGVVGTATSGTDYAPATTGSSILKASSGGFANAVSGTDYAPATTGSSILKASSGGFANATSGIDYAPATSGNNILYGNGSGGFANVTIGTGLTFSAGNLSNSSVNIHGVQLFTSSGTFVAPAGITKVYLTMVGGGGSSGGSSGGNGSGGGGAGASVINFPYTVIPGNSYTVTVGAGGTAVSGFTTPGNDGGATSFDGTVSCPGGGGSAILHTGGIGGGNSATPSFANQYNASATTSTASANPGSYIIPGGNGSKDNGGGGNGGGTPFGTGGLGINGIPGNNAVANTGAGGGGINGNGTSGAGGSGFAAVIY